MSIKFQYYQPNDNRVWTSPGTDKTFTSKEIYDFIMNEPNVEIYGYRHNNFSDDLSLEDYKKFIETTKLALDGRLIFQQKYVEYYEEIFYNINIDYVLMSGLEKNDWFFEHFSDRINFCKIIQHHRLSYFRKLCKKCKT